MSSYQRHRKRKRRRLRKRERQEKALRERCDYHHFLFQKKHWQGGYAHQLREHPYAGAYIPQATLHRAIHSKLHDVPRPNGDVCKRTLMKLKRLEEEGLIDPKRDSPEKKLQFFIDEWQEECPATAEMLRWMQQLVIKFYNKQS